MNKTFSLGLDFGTNSVRALLVSANDGREVATHVYEYVRGDHGVILDPEDPNVARQHPQEWVKGIEQSVSAVLEIAKKDAGFSPDKIIGIGIDTTGSTPLPIDREGNPLAFSDRFADNLDAMAWLWKDHTAHAEAAEITRLASDIRPEYLAKIGGTYSSEWFWAKILHCARVAPEVYDAAYTWVEYADWIPALLTDTLHPSKLKRSVCAAGHKALFHEDWGGYPEKAFLGKLDPKLTALRKTLPDKAYTSDVPAGELSAAWAKKLGLNPNITVAVGGFDAHLGGVGSGIKEGTLVKIIGTSTCDMMVASKETKLPDIPGLCGIVPGSIMPQAYGLEAGQSAVGDIFNWFVNYIQPGGKETGSHQALTERAEKLKPGESGLLALDWHNGNRTVLVDQRLTGMIVGLTLHSKPEEIYRALIEATAFGARVIMERFEEYGQTVRQIINCGGISVKNPLVMQIYADVMGRPLKISRSAQTCALGAALAGAVAAGSEKGGYASFEDAAERMTGTLETEFLPVSENVGIYDRLYGLYKKLHDAFGTKQEVQNLYDVMKSLLDIRDEVRSS